MLVWVLLAFASGSIPWAVWLGRLFLGSDIRTFGDKNPGAANVWRVGGWRVGGAAVFLDFCKGAIPVFLAVKLGGLEGWSVTLVGLAPILGHAFSPLLGFRGGRALTVSAGVWTALTMGEAFPVICFFLVMFYSLQKTDSWTIMLSGLCFLGFLLARFPEPYVLLIWAGNMGVLALKHRDDLKHGIVPRDWLLRMIGRET